MSFIFKVITITCLIIFTYVISFSQKNKTGDVIQNPLIYQTQPDLSNCTAGELKESEKSKVLDYVNYIRNLHGLKPVIYNYAGDSPASEAALICAANATLTHNPSSSMKCYSEVGKSGCQGSNLHFAGYFGSNYPTSESSITGWLIDDHAAQPEHLGHRLAIINPFLRAISYGRCDGQPEGITYQVTTASLYYQNNVDANISDTDLEFVAYPFNDYPPQLVNKEFYLSFSAIYNKSSSYQNGNVDYNNVEIEVLDGSGNPMNVKSVGYNTQAWGSMANCLRWMVDGLQDGVTYTVNISKVVVNGQQKDYTYWFNLREPQPELPEKPTLIAPANNAVDQEYGVSLRWNPAVRAQFYSVQFADNEQFNSPILDVNNHIDISHAVAGLEAEKTYYWRVKAFNNKGESSWSDVWSFTTKEPPSLIPVLYSPEEGAVDVPLKPEFIWSEIPTAVSYNIQLAASKNFDLFQQYYDKDNIRDTIFLLDASVLPGPKKIYWRVRANTEALTGEWSEPMSFTTVDAASVDDQIADDMNSIKVYPNPASDVIYLDIDSKTYGPVSFFLTDPAGRIVKEYNRQSLNQGENRIPVSLRNISTGTYFMIINSGAGISVKSITVGN